MKVRMEMNGTSAQDDFAKWAKLRRKHDKLHEQLEKNRTYTVLHKTVDSLGVFGIPEALGDMF